jgi:predicted RNA-binding protein with EMAP domain
MATELTDEQRLKEVVKSAIVEVLEERKDLVREVIEEALEDVALTHAIEEGDRTGIVNREEILRTLDGNH